MPLSPLWCSCNPRSPPPWEDLPQLEQEIVPGDPGSPENPQEGSGEGSSGGAGREDDGAGTEGAHHEGSVMQPDGPELQQTTVGDPAHPSEGEPADEQHPLMQHAVSHDKHAYVSGCGCCGSQFTYHAVRTQHLFDYEGIPRLDETSWSPPGAAPEALSPPC